LLLITAVIKSKAGQESENSLSIYMGLARPELSDSRRVTMRDPAR